jgi:K+-transporting ATPase ATPase A chain
MTIMGLFQLLFFLAALLLLAKPLGGYMARVYQGERCGLGRLLGPLERLIYRLGGVKAEEEMTWAGYAAALLVFNLLGGLALYGLQRLQGLLPLNPAGLGAVEPYVAFNTAASFASNTNWQAYAGETTMSFLTQMLGLTVQNFVSAASGLAVLVAFIRGFVRREAQRLGNFWVDLVRSVQIGRASCRERVS